MNTIAEVRFNYGEHASINTVVQNGGTSVHSPKLQGMDMNVTTAAGSSVLRYTNLYMAQASGRTTFFAVVLRMGPQKAGVVSRFGLYDQEDGVYIERTSQGLFLCLRNKASGVVVETRVHQSEWNGDRLDGNGPSGFTLDPDKLQWFVVRMASMGIGNVKVGFNFNGRFIQCHYFTATNTGVTPVLRGISLPFQAEIFNEITTDSASNMFVGNLSVYEEGSAVGPSPRDALNHFYDAGSTARAISTTAWTPVVSFRLGLLKNGVKYRGKILMSSVNVIIHGAGIVQYQAVVNGTLTGPNFVAGNPGSCLERDINASAITGGRVINTGYIMGGAPSTSIWGQDGSSVDKMVGHNTEILRGRPDNSQDILTVCMKGLETGMSAFLVMNYLETED